MLSNLKTGVGWGLRFGKCMTGSGKACPKCVRGMLAEKWPAENTAQHKGRT